jgi:hypothetical protein
LNPKTSNPNPPALKKYTKKEIRDAAASAIHGLLARLEVPLKGRTKKLAKELSKILAREVSSEYKKHVKKERRKLQKVRSSDQ